MTAPTTTTYDAIKRKQVDLIRKAVDGSIFLAPYSAPMPTSLTSGASGDLVPLPTGYEDIGWTDKGTGATWSRSATTTDVTSWGSVEPTRTDITKQTDDLKFIAQETKRAVLEVYEGVDLTSVTPDASSGEVTFDRPPRPAIRYFRVFGLFVDGVGPDTIYVAKVAPRAIVTATADQKWSDDQNPVQYEVTLAAMYDDATGTAMRFFFGGPGWKAMLADMGFPAATG